MNTMRHKRWISTLMAMVMAFSLLPAHALAVEGECAHTNTEILPATWSCTKNGLSEGLVCLDCYTLLIPQEPVIAPGHDEKPVAGYGAGCTSNGLSDGVQCDRCKTWITPQTPIPFTGHTTTNIPYQAPTCTEPGNDAGSYCSKCDEVFDPAEELPATGHKCATCGELLAHADGTLADEHSCEGKTVTASCGGGGYTEYTCQNPGCEFSYKENVQDATGHSWDEGTVTSEPTCTEPGIRTFTCTVCYGITTEPEPASGHKWEDVPAKLPTYATPGYSAHQKCPDCLETTEKTTTPALTKSDIKDFDTFMKYLKLLEKVANDYAKENPGKDPMGVLIKYIRTGVDRYNSGSWKIMAGYEDEEFVKYVENYEEKYNLSVDSTDKMIQVTSMKNIEPFALPSGEKTDIGHMFGTMDISYTNINSENHADVAGWGGDLCDLLSLVDQYGVTGTLEEMVEEIGEDYFLRETFPVEPVEGTFGATDFIGDLDGLYVMQMLTGEEYVAGRLYDILDKYFTADLSNEDRADFMIKNRLDGISSRAGLREKVYTEYTSNKVIATLENTRNYSASSSVLSDLRRACCYAFADYLCKLAGDYVEAGENIYYDVFSTETSVLAPGITQEINMAHTADQKQIRYYLATADLTSDYVHVYANYKDNDPTEWGMQRVEDQMLAAQAKYGDPESPLYIENYNVIAGINGAGYDMTTGEPGGLLIMGGVEYHEPNANGFFGILKDGTPIIGTTAEYEQLHAEGKVMEGIAGFGATLVKDGQLMVSYAENHTGSRASRTAVGITRTGKVVFMVMDGRQEPVSCGGSMQEIAQVMLEAGCVHAINLDGGGSTTYVAKQAGDDEISLVSSPSDGFQRSVSTSLLMVSTAPSSTAFERAVLDAETRYLTAGSSIQITAAGVSPMGNAVAVPEEATWAVADNTIGTIDANGVFTALSEGNTDVHLMLGEKIVGTYTVYVVIPDALYFTKTPIDAIYGANTELSVKAQYEGKAVVINANDVNFSLTNPAAGSINGFVFVGNEESGLRNVSVIATLKKDETVTASVAIALYKNGEASFDFDQATAGDRQLAWDRQVSNAITEDGITYMVEELGEDMTTSYIFAIDMTQIPIPEQLEELVYMLPGADVEGANTAWAFLLQLAERVNPATVVMPTIQFDPNMKVDINDISILNEYFELQKNGVQLDEETNTLTIRMNWIDQTKAIDASTANPMCILSGIKLTPKDDADWGAQKRLTVKNTGNIAYKIYLRANALYSFAMKPENQETFDLMPYDFSEGDTIERGGVYESIYKQFEDEYTLINAGKNGWVYEDGGYAYYVDGVKYTGIRKVDGYFYDFGTDGINVGQNKYTGLFVQDGVTYYAKAGVPASGWVKLGSDSYYFEEDGKGCEGTKIVEEVEMIFEGGKLIGGYSGFITKSNGKTYYYVSGLISYSWCQIGGHWYHFNSEDGSMTTGTKVLPDAEAKSKGAYYDFADDGKLLRAYFNGAGYYYWIGMPLLDAWVKNGADPDPDAWYRTNGSGHFVTDRSGAKEVRISITGNDGVPVVYTFDNSNGKLLKGDVHNDNGTLYYYWAGKPLTNCWYTTTDGVTYYAYADGHLAVGSQTIDGTAYEFDSTGKLLNAEPALNITMTGGNSTMKVELTNAMGRAHVRFAVWQTSDMSGTLRWIDAVKGADGIWRADVPMCVIGQAGQYAVHAYATTSGIQTPQTIDYVTLATAPEHVYTNRLDDTCEQCDHVREVFNPDPVVTATLSADNKEMTIKLSYAWDRTAVRFAVWATSVAQDQTLRWVDAVQVDESTWMAAIPMCGTGVAGQYAVHAYDQTNTPVTTTTANLTALPAHTHADSDGLCDLCGKACTHTGGTATCTAKAVCDQCGNSYGELNAANHSGVAEWNETATHHSKEYTCCHAVVVPQEDHKWNGGVCSDCGYGCSHTGGTATCTAKAVCSECGNSYGALNASNHTGTAEWTKTATHHSKAYTCCSAPVIPQEEHDWTDGVCTECGYTCTHTGGTATCTAKAICTTCGSSYGTLNPAKHTGTAEWTKTATHHSKAYTCCQASVVANEIHEWNNGVCGECGYGCTHSGGIATCTAKAICAACGNPYGELNANKHSGTAEWTKNGTHHSKAYTCCHAVVVPQEEHKWNGSVCSECLYSNSAVNVAQKPAAANVAYAPDLKLSASVLTGGQITNIGGTTIPGTWAWAEPNTQLYAGKASYTAIFTPADSNLDGTQTTVEVTVTPAAQTLTSIHGSPEDICTFYAGPGLEMRDMVSSNMNVSPVFVIIEDEGEAYVEGTVLYSPDAGFVTVEAQFPGVDVNGDGTHEYAPGSVEIHTKFTTVPMFRMYDPNAGEHFYTGSELERDTLVTAGWNYEGVGFNYPAIGAPVYRLYNPVSGDHLYTMDEAEIAQKTAGDWHVEGVAFNSAPDTEVAQYRLWNPNAVRGAWHFTSDAGERAMLISVGWQDQGIGWYSTLK